MDTYITSVYLSEVEKQCKFAILAIEQINFALNVIQSDQNLHYEQREALHNDVFRGIHSFLTHTSNISKLLWPAPPRKRKGESQNDYDSRKAQKIAQAAHLRQLLSITDSGSPLKSRELRDHLEHFDERLDEWVETSSRRNFVQDFIGPRSSIGGIDDSDIMRMFDPSTATMIFRDETYNLQAIATAVDKLLPLVQNAVETVRRRVQP